jgi:hypothetical protein
LRYSYPNLGTTLLPATNHALKDKVSAAILPFPLKHVADAACRTTEAVKKWRSGLSCPDLASAINLARDIPAIKWLIYREIEGGAPEGIFSTRTVVEAMSLLQAIAADGGEHAAKARAILSGVPHE